MARKVPKEKKPVDLLEASLLGSVATMSGIGVFDLCAEVLQTGRALVVPYKTQSLTVNAIPGCTLKGQVGPQPADVMIVGRCPGAQEDQQKMLVHGDVHRHLCQLFAEHGLDYGGWYYTNIVKYSFPYNIKTIPAPWLVAGKLLLDIEIDIVKPRIIFALGTDVIKMLSTKSDSLQRTRGTILQYRDIAVIPTYSPAIFKRDYAFLPEFRQDIGRLAAAVDGSVSVASDCEYHRIETAAGLKRVVDFCIERPETRYAMDCEWGGTHGTKYTRGKLRCIQFSCRTHEAFRIVLRYPGLVDNPELPEAFVAQELNRLLDRPGISIAGHNFRSDWKYLERMGVRCEEQFIENGFDTMLAYNLAYQSKSGNGLEQLSLRFTDLGRYDREVQQWLTTNGYNETRLDAVGYADVPEHMFDRYACCDPDVVLRTWQPLIDVLTSQLMTNPYELNGIPIQNLYDHYRNIVHPVNLPLHEMEVTGMFTDTERMKTVTRLANARLAELLAEFREGCRWPEFNQGSDDNVREFLFGYVPGKRDQRPADAIVVGAWPIKTTEKPSRDWERVPQADKEKMLVMPATDAETIENLMTDETYAEHKDLLRRLHHLKVLDQLVTNFLRMPDVKVEIGQYGERIVNYCWDHGLVGEVDQDGRTRTDIGQLTDTGRGTSSNPNLQNLPNKQEKVLRQIFSRNIKLLESIKDWYSIPLSKLKAAGAIDPDYYSIRSCYTAPPGWLLIEADYAQAELNVLAHLAHDTDMITVLENLDRDLHSEMAIKAFRLTCTPQEVNILFKHLRIAAKATLFGLLYGRGAGAIVRQLGREGIKLTRDEAQAIIDTVYKTFPKLKSYIQSCHEFMLAHHYVENAYGRRRYFSKTDDTGLLAAYKRQAQNSPIQGTVGDMLNLALINIRQYRDAAGLQFKLVLPVHDAIFIEAPVHEARHIYQDVMPACMSDLIPVPGTKLVIRADVSIVKRWGEKMKLDEAIEFAEEELRQLNATKGKSSYEIVSR